MKRILSLIAAVVLFASCGNESTTSTSTDTSAKASNIIQGPVDTAGKKDSLHGGALNGSRVNPIDTANPNKQKP